MLAPRVISFFYGITVIITMLFSAVFVILTFPLWAIVVLLLAMGGGVGLLGLLALFGLSSLETPEWLKPKEKE